MKTRFAFAMHPTSVHRGANQTRDLATDADVGDPDRFQTLIFRLQSDTVGLAEKAFDRHFVIFEKGNHDVAISRAFLSPY